MPPPPPPDPVAQASALTQDSPEATLGGLLADGVGGDPAGLLNQTIGLSAPSAVNPLAGIELLTPNSYRMPSGDLPSPYALQSGVPPSPFARVDAFRGARAVTHGALGRMPGVELGQALPGTAPPPGTRIPPGLEQFYVDPSLVDPSLADPSLVAPIPADPNLLPPPPQPAG